MPNTLAHIAINIPLTKLGIKHTDTKWILLGVLLPDIPWIGQRIITKVTPGINPYFLRIYLIIQASLLFSIILSLSFAFLSSNRTRTFLVLTFGSLLHLITDSLEIKWANGVNLFAPFDWTILNIGLFWPESLPVYILSVTGLVVLGLQFFNTKESIQIKSPGKWIYVFIIILIIYFVTPFLFFDSVINADSHYVKTFTDKSRSGQYFELDRAFIVDSKDGDYIETYANEILFVKNIDLSNSGKISIKGRFITNNEIIIMEYYLHDGGIRNALSISGILFIMLYWFVLILRGFRQSRVSSNSGVKEFAD